MAHPQSLKERLNAFFPDVLPDSPDEAIGGTELLKRLRKGGIPRQHSDDTLRNYFSWMSKDPTSTLAKVDQGRGYYCRSLHDREDLSPDPSERSGTRDAEGRRADQREEKFRSLFMLWSMQQRYFPMHLEHTEGSRRALGSTNGNTPR